jgi:hypothetical protein
VRPLIVERVDLTAMHNDLRRTQNNYVYIANLLSAIATGNINLVNPSQNTQAQLDFIRPDNITDASSDLYAAQATFGRSLFDLPGGPLQLGFGGAIRYEAVDAPSGNAAAGTITFDDSTPVTVDQVVTATICGRTILSDWFAGETDIEAATRLVSKINAATKRVPVTAANGGGTLAVVTLTAKS